MRTTRMIAVPLALALIGAGASTANAGPLKTKASVSVPAVQAVSKQVCGTLDQAVASATCRQLPATDVPQLPTGPPTGTPQLPVCSGEPAPRAAAESPGAIDRDCVVRDCTNTIGALASWNVLDIVVHGPNRSASGADGGVGLGGYDTLVAYAFDPATRQLDLKAVGNPPGIQAALRVAIVNGQLAQAATLFIGPIHNASRCLPNPPCNEDGIGAIGTTPAAGSASAVIHGLEPQITAIDPATGDLVHVVNCQIAVPVEDTVDSSL